MGFASESLVHVHTVDLIYVAERFTNDSLGRGKASISVSFFVFLLYARVFFSENALNVVTDRLTLNVVDAF